jgi:hypothetical protein
MNASERISVHQSFQSMPIALEYLLQPEREDNMKDLLSISLIATALASASAAAAELPIYELMGFPITPHQLVTLGPANIQERAPVATLTLAGMPASPHQIAVLTPRRRVISGQIAGQAMTKPPL